MKGILLFDSLNDLAFLDIDDALSRHIEKLAFKDGLLEDLEFKNCEGTVDKNIIIQLFSPLIASYKVMHAQFGNKYKYIETEDDVLLVFEEILNYVAISICHKDEKLSEVQKELILLQIVVSALFGPSLHMIKSDIHTSCKEVTRSNLLSLIIKKWRVMKMEQQMYLVEAIERIIINQDITAMCINLLQEVLEKIRCTHKEGIYSHTFALVDSKLLALYSSRNAGTLSKDVLLFLILVVHVLKRTSDTDHNRNESSQSSDDEFFIPITTNTKAKVFKDGKKIKKSLRKMSTKDDLKDGIFYNGAHNLLLYLKSRSGDLVPHILYVVEVTSRITIVILNELNSYGTVSSSINSLIKQLTNLQCHPFRRKPIGTFDVLEKNYKGLVDLIWKSKIIEDKEKYMKKLVSKWEQLKQYDIEIYFELSPNEEIDYRLESGLSSCCDMLKSLFEEVVALPCLKYEENTHSVGHQEVLKLIQKFCSKTLADIAEFLEVKALQNITMASYISLYPGLIHFIYIDRKCDSLIAPGVIQKKSHLSGATSLKQKVWKMVTSGRRYIDGSNNYCCLWKDCELYYFHNIWFEDTMGNIIKPTSYPSLKTFPRKGILCGNFYKKLIEECFPNACFDHIQCYEFFSIHLESTTPEQIVKQSRKLCSQLWDFGGAYRNSLDLL